jgi:hypothetical protein
VAYGHILLGNLLQIYLQPQQKNKSKYLQKSMSLLTIITLFKICQQHFQRINPQQQFVRYNVKPNYISMQNLQR